MKDAMWAFLVSLAQKNQAIVLSLFRTNQLLYSVLLIFYAGLLHLSVFVTPDSWQPESPGLLSSWIYGLLGGYTGWGASVTALLLLVAQAIGINAIALEYRLGEEQNQFPGLFFVSLSCIFPGMMHLSPALMANTFVIIALGELFSIYKKPSAAGAIFNTGWWIALASLFSPPYIIFLVLAFVALNVLRGLSVKERLMLLTGILTPYLLAGAWLFWKEMLSQGIEQQLHQGLGWIGFKDAPRFTVWASGLLMGLVILIVIGNYPGLVYRKTIQVQKYIGLLYWMLLTGALTLIVQPKVQIEQWLTVSIPAGMLLGFVFSNLPRRWAESLHLMLFATVLILQYKQFLLP